MEAEFENEARKGRDLAAENRKLQRQLVEQKNQSEADRRVASETTEQCHALQQRVKTLKRQLDEAVSNTTHRIASSSSSSSSFICSFNKTNTNSDS